MNRKWLFRIIGISTIIAIWTVIGISGTVSSLVLPSITDVLNNMKILYSDSHFWKDVLGTVIRMLAGFSIGSALGVIVGLAMGFSERIYDMLEFIVDFFRSIPATALFPLFMIAFGIEDGSKIALAAWTCGLVMTVNTMSGVHSAKHLRIKAARTLNISGFNLLRKIILPEALPHIASGARIALSLSLIVTIVTEMFIGTDIGLGKRITEAQQIYAIPEMYVAIISAGFIGYTINRIAVGIERRILHWHGK